MASDLRPTPKTILVVDDDISVLTVVKCMLECDDYDLLLANSAETALRLIEREDLVVDLMITDVVMPDMNGGELAECALRFRPRLRILFMSGYCASEVIRVKVLEGTSGLLAKPFSSTDLHERVRRALNAPFTRAAAASASGSQSRRPFLPERKQLGRDRLFPVG